MALVRVDAETAKDGDAGLKSLDRRNAGSEKRLAAILTRSAKESAFIFCITCPLCAFTVISLMPSSAPACLLEHA